VLPLTCMVHTAAATLGHDGVGHHLGERPQQRHRQAMPTTCRAVHGAGLTAFTMEPSGASTLIGASEPALFGTSGFSTDRSVKVV
jgi:hypothetical protein